MIVNVVLCFFFNCENSWKILKKNESCTKSQFFFFFNSLKHKKKQGFIIAMQQKICMRTLLQLPLMEDSCFSSEQLIELKVTKQDKSKIYEQVMINPLEFQGPVSTLYDLQMCFRPILKHNQVLDSGDISNLMIRYIYWLGNISVFTLQIVNQYCFDKIVRNWNNSRYHIGFRRSIHFWSCILIDRDLHTFEFYDPQFTDVSMLEDVVGLFEQVKTLDPILETKTMQLIRRGFASNNSKYCAFSMLRFIHDRIVENKKFEQIVLDPMSNETCEKIRDIFFQTNDVRFVAHCAPDYPNTVYQVAIIDFSSFLDYLVKINDDLQIKQDLREYQIGLENVTNEPTKAASLAISIQEQLTHILPLPLVEYVGTNVWQRIVEEICSDPLAYHLLKMEKKQRLAIFLDLYIDMQSVSLDFTTHVLNNVYKNYTKITNPDLFFEWSASRKSLIYFGVHLLRQMENWLKKKKLNESKLSQEFPIQSNLVKPLYLTNMNEIQNSIERCDLLVEEAQTIIAEYIQDIVSLKPQLDFPKVHTLLLLNEMDLLNQTYLKRLEAWNFPMSQDCELLNHLEPRFSVYSCNESELKACLESELFKMYYTIGIWIAKNAMKKNLLIDTNLTESVILQSLHDFYNVSTNLNQKIFCCLLDLFGERRYDCDFEKASRDSADFFIQTKTLYKDILSMKS